MRWRSSVSHRRVLELLLLVTCSLSIACRATSPSVRHPDPELGVSLALATERAQRIQNLRYDLTFDIPASPTEPIGGRATMRFALADHSLPLVLDFAPGAEAIQSLTVDGAKVPFTTINNHIVLGVEHIASREMTVDVTFRAGDAALNRSPEFLYTLFVPARAHLTFPCFDQPDLKARYSLTLSLPPTWTAVANGTETARAEAHGRIVVSYAETEPISTYLFAFVAGQFQTESAVRRGRTFRMLHRETDASKVARNRDAIFDLHDRALAWLEEYTAIPYPFGKFEFVMIPSFQFSGMEHPGALLYNASSMLLDPSATENQLLNRASTISHETAHMWFGDLVTMRWFDDVWMKEVFANFMAGKIVNPSFPNIDHDLRFLVANYPAAYGVDRTAGTHPIRQSLDNLSNAGSQYGAIIYQKAPIVMRQLERLIGEVAMREGLREYLSRFRFGNATWLDLVRILDDRTDRDLAAWSKAWIEDSGRPTIETALERDERGAVANLSFAQTDGQSGRGLQWTEAMEVLVGTDTTTRSFPVELNSSDVRVADAGGMAGVRFVLPTGGGLAYGNVVLDDASRQYLLRAVPGIRDGLTRGAVWITLWEELLERRVAPAAFIDAVLAALPREDVQQNAQLMVGYLRDAYWRFLGPAARLSRAPLVERAMREGIARRTTAGAKSIFFNGFRSMAETPQGVQYLERVWSRTDKIPGLPFVEQDEATMALELAVRSVPNAAAILNTQLERMTNPDRKARFAFVMPALSASAETRREFFASLTDVANRRREPWVLEALSYLHHPLRAAQSADLVLPALEMLHDIQRTGDIFFPRNWMDATLSGHRSRRVSDQVRQFLDWRPDYPVRLRRIILQSADDLFRAAAIDPQS